VCRTEFLDPQPTDARLGEIYGPSYYEPWDHESAEVVRQMKQRTFAPVLDAARVAPGDRVLDVGCATGDFVSLAAQRGLQVYGVDLNRAAIERAQLAVPQGRFHVGVLGDEPFEGEQFDAIVMIDFIEHVRDAEAELRFAARRLAPGGRIVMSTPRTDSLTRRLLGKAWPQYREEHLSYFSADGMRAVAQRAGLVVTDIRPTTKMLTLSYLYGQALAYPVPVVTPVLRSTWHVLPLPKHRPLGLRLGEMTVVAERLDAAA
jgi:2-polyprenyl-3-methyl-5-hydroxy-6-metoxy-1,4-benzoquinol methylase